MPASFSEEDILVRIPNAFSSTYIDDAKKRLAYYCAKGNEDLPNTFSSTYVDDAKKRLAYYRAKGNEDLPNTFVEQLPSSLFDLAAFMVMLMRQFRAWLPAHARLEIRDSRFQESSWAFAPRLMATTPTLPIQRFIPFSAVTIE
ncbi:MAG: hypothetical protein AAF191_12775 [Verrucomicrobiota bacterium]